MNYNKSFLLWINNNHILNNKRKENFDFLKRCNKIASYIFREGEYWYRFVDWDIPFSGYILRWKVDDKKDWEPKNTYNHKLNEENSECIFEMHKFKKILSRQKIFNVNLSNDGRYLLIVSKCINEFNLNVFRLNSLKKDSPIIIKNISIESSFGFIGNKLIFSKINNKKNIIFEKYLDSGEEQVVLSFKDTSFRPKIQSSEIENFLFVSFNKLESSEIYVLEEMDGKLFINKVWNKENIRPLNLSILLFEHCPVVNIAIKIKGNYNIISKYQINGEYKSNIIKIKNPPEIRYVSTFGHNIILHFKNNKYTTEFGIIMLDKNYLKNNSYLYKSVNFNGLANIYENNNSSNQLIFESSTEILRKSVYGVNLSKNLKKKKLFTANKINTNKDYDINHKTVWSKSRKNNVKIPITIYWLKKDSSLNIPKQKKAVIYVYGAYGQNKNDYELSPTELNIINNGFLYCVVHVRGGGFLGGKWYRQGKGLRKWNSIFDLIDCCDFMIKNKLINKKKIGLLSSSAGGCVAAAAFNQRPNLFKSILLFSPFIDPIDELTDSSNSFSKTEYFEWGNPNKDDVYDYIKSYSPLQNIKSNLYSPTEFITIGGKNDQFINYKNLINWNNKLINYGYNSHLLINKYASHGGIKNNQIKLLSKIFDSFFYLIDK